MACFLTVVFILAIFCDEKYLKLISLALLNWFFFSTNLIGSLLVSISASKPLLSPQIVYFEIVSLVIDVSMLQVLSYNVADFHIVRK